MTNQSQSPNFSKKYDLGERTAVFGEKVIDLAKTVQSTLVTMPLIRQVVRSSTSIGANYMEADAADTKKDFRFKIALCKKESKETMHWLRMLSRASPNRVEECRRLWKEAHELVLIFSTILKK